ncbi:hypothetical protein [Wolbachia pipientis]|uniref:hypothetical protein n=1 Tax=Wolbachia pipientis TaxID=955 RepID=UPI0025A47A38|nr:hypothetical protein [Wolbachia pipientis]MDM8335286.1 hypothetical protein [Wolbachia pipientis]
MLTLFVKIRKNFIIERKIYCVKQTTQIRSVLHLDRRKKLKNRPVTSGANRPTSWINVFANTIVGAITGVFQPVFSFKTAIGSNNSQPSKAITTQGIDISGTLSLLDVFIRKITGQSISPSRPACIFIRSARLCVTHYKRV